MGSLHKYLDYGTLLLAGVVATNGSHSETLHNAAIGAATLAVMTAVTGNGSNRGFLLDKGLVLAVISYTRIRTLRIQNTQLF
jgi:hypothetical protein